MREMAHSICLIKLYQITMRKNFDFLFLNTLDEMEEFENISEEFEWKYSRRNLMCKLSL